MKKILLIIILMFAVSSVFAFELGVSTSLLNKVKVTYTLEDYNIYLGFIAYPCYGILGDWDFIRKDLISTNLINLGFTCGTGLSFVYVPMNYNSFMNSVNLNLGPYFNLNFKNVRYELFCRTPLYIIFDWKNTELYAWADICFGLRFKFL